MQLAAGDQQRHAMRGVTNHDDQDCNQPPPICYQILVPAPSQVMRADLLVTLPQVRADLDVLCVLSPTRKSALLTAFDAAYATWPSSCATGNCTLTFSDLTLRKMQAWGQQKKLMPSTPLYESCSGIPPAAPQPSRQALSPLATACAQPTSYTPEHLSHPCSTAPPWLFQACSPLFYGRVHSRSTPTCPQASCVQSNLNSLGAQSKVIDALEAPGARKRLAAWAEALAVLKSCIPTPSIRLNFGHPVSHCEPAALLNSSRTCWLRGALDMCLQRSHAARCPCVMEAVWRINGFMMP